MADSQSLKKNKKAKKKSESNSELCANNEIKSSNNVSINSTLHKELNIKAPENVEITNVGSEKLPEEVDEETNRKKKKSKKKAKIDVKEAVVENTSSNSSFLNFSENGIHLVNHPEISVTFTGNMQSNVPEKECIKEKSPDVQEEKQDNSTISTSKKKKKRKKKSNNNVPDVPVCTNETVYTTTSSETAYTPTYTKVVTSDNTCVLVVNNEISSPASKSFVNLERKESKITENKVSFSVPSDKPTGDVLITRNFTPETNFKLGNSVSIFPVLSYINKNSEENTIISQPSLETVSNILKKEASDNAEKENTEDSKLTKAQLKAERRAKQEAQRAAKLAKSNIKVDSNSGTVVQGKDTKCSKEASPKKGGNTISEPISEKLSTKPYNVMGDKDSLRKVRLFSHLPQYKQLETNTNVHPAILEIGSQYSKGIICGSNARCVALLAALREIVKDYILPPEKNFCRELESDIQTYLSYLNSGRPLSVSMMNAVKFLKHQINHIPPEMEIDKAREKLCEYINDFVNEEILLAKEAIGNSASAKIVDGDVILVFAHSSLVKEVLCKAHNENKIFRVVVADSRPKLEGLKMLQCLVKQGLDCSYISINAVSYAMKEVSKVIIGAHALLSNGCVMSRLGSKQIALVASSYSVPVLVCCETYKFCERVLTDSFVHNELGEPEDITATTLVSNDSLKHWHDMSSLQLLNLLYDVTPSDLISMVITEKGVLPCTSVPVVLRVRYAGLHE